MARVAAANDISAEIKQALLQRLKMRVAFLTTVLAVDERVAPIIKSAWEVLSNTLPSIRDSHELGKPVPESFSVKLQRKLASTVPPRPIVETSFGDAYDHFSRLCRDGNLAAEILDYKDSHSLMVSPQKMITYFRLQFQTFVAMFQARKPQPAVYIRTSLQRYLFGDMMVLGTMSIRQLLDDDLASVVLPSDILLDRGNDDIELPTDPRFNMAQRMEIFRARAAQSYLDIFRTLCQNRCRIRRTLCHLVPDWDNLQLDGEELDIELRQFTMEQPVVDRTISRAPVYAFPLSSWAYFHKLRLMELIVQMGFELSIYQPEELASMYWYQQYLAQTRCRHLERIRGFVMRKFAASSRARTVSARQDPEYGRTLSFLNFSMLQATAAQGFADALTCLFVALKRLGLISTPSYPYSDAEKRYNLRMKPFLSIGLPELPSQAQTHALVNQPEEDIAGLLQLATEATGRAKKDFELIGKLDAVAAQCQGSEESWRKDVKDQLRACIMAGITIATLTKAFDKADKKDELGIKVEWPADGKGYHDFWVVPKLVPLA